MSGPGNGDELEIEEQSLNLSGGVNGRNRRSGPRRVVVDRRRVRRRALGEFGDSLRKYKWYRVLH